MASTTSSKPDAYLTTSTTTSEGSPLPFDSGKLWASTRPQNEKKPGETKLFFNVAGDDAAFGVIASTGTAYEKKGDGERKEALRIAVANGVEKLKVRLCTTMKSSARLVYRRKSVVFRKPVQRTSRLMFLAGMLTLNPSVSSMPCCT